MASKYHITHSCGHTQQHSTSLPLRQRDDWQAYLGGQICWECEKAARNEHAAKVSEEQALPELQGSDKQVAWANTIRLQVIENLQKKCTEYLDRVRKHPDTAHLAEHATIDLVTEMNKVRQETSAKFFIDNRDIVEQTNIFRTWQAKLAAKYADQFKK